MRCVSALLLLAPLCAAPAADAGEKGKKEVAELRKEIGELRTEVKNLKTQIRTLQLLVNQLATRKPAPVDAREVRRKAAAEIDALCARLRGLGEKAKDSEEYRKLMAFGSHSDRSVRYYQAAALGKLPLSVAGEAIKQLLREGTYAGATQAVAALSRNPKADCRDAVATRAKSTLISSKAPDGMYREQFILAACDYLVARKDPRGVRIYMAKLGEQYAEIPEMKRNRAYSMMRLMRADLLNRYSVLSGYQKQFKTAKKWVSSGDPALQKFVGDFLGWWKKNQAGFKKIAEPKDKPKGDPVPPKGEQF